jgi:hypothetical protein
MKFKEFTDNFYNKLLPLIPETASLSCGKEEYAGYFTDYSDYARSQYADLIFQTLPKAHAVIPNTPDEKLDHKLLIGFLELEAYTLNKYDSRYIDPSIFLPFDTLDSIFNYPFIDKPEIIIRALKKAAKLLFQGQECIPTSPEKVVKKWLENSLTSLKYGIELIKELQNDKRIQEWIPNEHERDDLLENIVKESEKFQDILLSIQLQAQAEYAVGKEHFDLILKWQHHIPLNHEKIYNFGKNIFDKTQQEITTICRKIDDKKTPQEIIHDIKSHSPKSQEVISQTKKYWREVSGFVKEKDILSWPKKEKLSIQETPDFQKHQVPFACIKMASQFDKKQTSYYKVTPPTTPEGLHEFSYEGLATTVIHEGIGHHIQATSNNKNKKVSTPIRALTSSAINYEGWALYCEQMLWDEGYRKTPERQLIILTDRLWRALRILIDVQTQCYGQTYEDARDEMVTKLGFTPEQVEADLNWYAHSPGVPMGYATGYMMLNFARDAFKQYKKHRFSLKNFHDEFLATCDSALPLCIEKAFSERITKTSIAKLKKFSV